MRLTPPLPFPLRRRERACAGHDWRCRSCVWGDRVLVEAWFPPLPVDEANTEAPPAASAPGAFCYFFSGSGSSAKLSRSCDRYRGHRRATRTYRGPKPSHRRLAKDFGLRFSPNFSCRYRLADSGLRYFMSILQSNGRTNEDTAGEKRICPEISI